MDAVWGYSKDHKLVEIFFDEMPSVDVRDRLKKNSWRWNGTRKCWSNTITTDNEEFAEDICQEVTDFNAYDDEPVDEEQEDPLVQALIERYRRSLSKGDSAEKPKITPNERVAPKSVVTPPKKTKTDYEVFCDLFNGITSRLSEEEIRRAMYASHKVAYNTYAIDDKIITAIGKDPNGPYFSCYVTFDEREKVYF